MQVKRRAVRWWFVPIMVGLALAVAVIAASASTAAPEASEIHWARLSTVGQFGAYPDIATGANGLVAVVWTEGDDVVVKHSGALKLAWADNTNTKWTVVTVDDGNSGLVYDAAVTVSGSTIHVVWSRGKNTLRYATCQGPGYSCASSQRIATASQETLQVDVVADGSGTPHVVWVEDDGKVHYIRKAGSTWPPESSNDIVSPSANDQEAPAAAYANGYVHLVWTQWMDVEHTNAKIRYCRRGVSDSSWPYCTDLVPSWSTVDHLARNVSITADTGGNVYVVWDAVSPEDPGIKRQYVIGYKHATNNGENWRTAHYADGTVYSEYATGVEYSVSGEGSNVVEYMQFLRPHVSLAMSGTTTVPVLSWHSQSDPTSGGEGIVQAVADNPHKVLWTYATQPGSYAIGSGANGYMYWASDYFTASTDICGALDMNVSSASGRLAVVGELKQVLDGESPGNHLHTVYHEQAGGGFWAAFYNNTGPHPCFGSNLPVLFRNAISSGDD